MCNKAQFMLYQCNECEVNDDGAPCTLIIPSLSEPPERCPYTPRHAERDAQWKLNRLVDDIEGLRKDVVEQDRLSEERRSPDAYMRGFLMAKVIYLIDLFRTVFYGEKGE